jgi:hypothetical protein
MTASLHRPVLATAGRATQRLAVNGEHPAASRARRAQPLSQPRAERPVEPVGVHARKDPADGGLPRDLPATGERVTAHPERGQDRPWRIRGPLGDRGHTPGAGQHRRGAEGQHAGQGVASSPPGARVREYGQPFQQAGALAHGERAGMIGVGDSSGDGE